MSQQFTNTPSEELRSLIDRDGVVFRKEEMKVYLSENQFVSAGKLHDMISGTPRQFLYNWMNPDEDTAALIFGSAFHMMALEPPKFFDLCYAVLKRDMLPEPDKDFRNSANKNYRDMFTTQCEMDGKIMLTEEDHATMEMMCEQLDHNPTTKNIMSQDGITELSVYTKINWNDRDYYVKIRPDRVSLIKPFYLDLKKTRNASPEKNKFPKDAFVYGYDMKMSLYFDILKEHWEKLLSFAGVDLWKSGSIINAIATSKSELKRSLIIAVEDTPPFNIAVYNIPEETMEIGRYRYRSALSRFGECLKTGEWQGYEMFSEDPKSGIVELILPAYANTEIII